MNELKMDKLFQEKLATYEVQPSTDAWNKIDSSIQNKRGRKNYWLYAVAASLVLILTSVFIWTSQNNYPDNIVAENDILKPTIQTTTDGSTSSQEEVTKTAEQGILVNKQNKTQLSTDASEEVIPDDLEYVQNNINEYPDIHSNFMTVSFVKAGPDLDPVSAQLSPDFEYIPEENIDLTLPKGETGIKKVFDYALRVKNGEEKPINLRKAKDDLFAMAKNIKLNQSKLN